MGKKKASSKKAKPLKPSKSREFRELKKRRGLDEEDRQFKPQRDVTYVTK